MRTSTKAIALAVLICVSSSAIAEDINYKDKTLPDLLDLCNTNDSFACFLAASRQKKLGQSRARLTTLELGASVPGTHNNRSLVCMYYLAKSHAEGDGVPQDFEQGYKWANILSALPSDAPFHIVGKGLREKLAASMTPEQLASAQRASKEWFAQHPDW